MKVEVTESTEEEKRNFVLALTKVVMQDSRKHQIFESDDDEIDMFLEFKQEVVSVNKILIEKNSINRTLFSGLILGDDNIGHLGHSVMPYYQFFEVIDGELMLCEIDFALNF